MYKVLQIALSTFRESVRSKVLYSVLFFAALTVFASTIFGRVTIGSQINVIKNFGLFSISIFSVLFAVISGTTLLAKELSRKTVFNILAKAVQRWEFLLGKYLGMLLTALVILSLMGFGLFGYSYLYEGFFDSLILLATLHIFFELIIVCACAIFFSSLVVTPILSGLFTCAVFLVGRSRDYLLYFMESADRGELQQLLIQAIYNMLPALDKINITNLVVYGKGASPTGVLASFAYATGYAAILLILSHFIFRRRDFN